MKRTTRYVPKGINESVGGSRGTFRVPLSRKEVRKSVNESLGMLNTHKTGSPLFEAVKSDTIVTAENIDSVIRKIKKLTGCKVCLKGDNLVCCEGEKVIIRRVLNGKRTVDAVVELVKAYLEKADAAECRKEIKESVAERFAAYRHLYESDEEDDEALAEDEEAPAEKPEAAEEPEAEEQKDKKEEDEDVPMTAVVLTVKKGDGAKLKDELIEAGIPEDDVDVIEGEEDDEDDKVKVDANSIFELKDFLKEKKDIDLEEKLGGEIIDDEAEPEDKDGEDGEEDKKEDDDLDFGDADFDALFGADDDSADAE